MSGQTGRWSGYLRDLLGYDPGPRDLERAAATIEEFRREFLPALKPGQLDPGCPFDPTHSSLFPRDPGLPAALERALDRRPEPEPAPQRGDITDWTMAQAQAALEHGLVSARQLAEAYTTRLEKYEPLLGAMAVATPAEALLRADQLDRDLAAGLKSGPLTGVPIGVKDLFDVRGVPTAAGSPIYRDRVPETDASVVALLRAAGAVLLGMTITHEFAWGATGENPHFGTPRNPWDQGRLPGGSSSGSGVGVAAGLFPAALGSDTGGSIRMPASLCGTVGLKPTYGLLSRQGLFPFSPSLDHAGPLTRRVRDAARLLTVMSAPDPSDPTRLPFPARDYERALEVAPRHLKGVRLGLVENWMGSRVCPGVRKKVKEAAQALEDLGAAVRPVSLPSDQDMLAVNLLISYPEGAALHLPTLSSRPGDYGPDVRRGLEQALGLTAGEYLAALGLRGPMCRQVDLAMGDLHALVLPSTPLTAPRMGEKLVSWEDGSQEEVNDALGRFTAPFNVTGQPALSVPAGLWQGLPVGLQLVSRPLREEILLWIGAVYLEATGWQPEPPDFP